MVSSQLKDLYNLSNHKELDKIEIRLINYHVKSYGVDGAIDNAISTISSCRIINPSGFHQCQTTSYRYRLSFAEIIYIFDNYKPTYDVKDIVDKCNIEHQLNLEFEKDNPPLDLSSKKQKVSRRKIKSTEIDMFPDIPKVKQQAKKLSANLHFNFKIDNGKTSV